MAFLPTQSSEASEKSAQPLHSLDSIIHIKKHDREAKHALNTRKTNDGKGRLLACPPYCKKAPVKNGRIFCVVPQSGIEPLTRGFSVPCSTD